LSTGPAGGDLAGNFPNPTIAPGAIGTVGLFNTSLKDGVAGLTTLRSLGTGAQQAAAGNDGRFPSGTEKSALAGTSGAPSSTNPYVTTNDPRNTDARTPIAGSVTPPSFGSLPAAKAVATTSQALPPGAFVKVALDSIDFTPGVTFDNASDSLQIQTPGIYQVIGQVEFKTNSSGFRALAIDAGPPGNVTDIGDSAGAPAPAIATGINTTTLTRFAAGDVVQLYAAQDSASTLSTDDFANRSATLSVNWVGP
jgi:hypothetical protein